MKNLRALLPLFLAMCLMPLTVGAQQPAVPPPVGLLPMRMPEMASWTITFVYVDEAVARTAQPGRGDRVKTITISKTGETYLEQTTRRSGGVEEKWVYNGVQFKGYRNNTSILLISPPSGDGAVNPEWSDYSKGDFPELAWLVADNYAGVEKYDKKTVWLFNKDNQRAWLNPETKLPIATTNGQITMTYTYNAAPEDPLIPPQKYLDILAKYRRGLEALSFRPSRSGPLKQKK